MDKSKKNKFEISVSEYNDMKANAEIMKLNLSQMEEELEQKKSELNTTKKELEVLLQDLREVRSLLRSSVDLRIQAEEMANQCETALREVLFCWLSKESQSFVKNILRFYKPIERANMMRGLLEFLLFGKRRHFLREVEKTHFSIICEKIDDDAVVLPAHSFMVSLMKKYGLLESITER